MATGGGTPLREDNRLAMKNAGVPVILLEASSKETFERLQGDDTRPLAAGLDETSLENLKNQRRQAYEECADYAIKTDEMTPLEITEKSANCSKMREKSSVFSLIRELFQIKIREKLQNGIANLIGWLYNLKQS